MRSTTIWMTRVRRSAPSMRQKVSPEGLARLGGATCSRTRTALLATAARGPDMSCFAPALRDCGRSYGASAVGCPQAQNYPRVRSVSSCLSPQRGRRHSSAQRIRSACPRGSDSPSWSTTVRAGGNVGTRSSPRHARRLHAAHANVAPDGDQRERLLGTALRSAKDFTPTRFSHRFPRAGRAPSIRHAR